MKMTYDGEIDALYISFGDAPIASSIDYPNGIRAEFDSEGQIIAIEILDLHEHLVDAEHALDAALTEDEEIAVAASRS
jgi:uncharacterized protein YuzE